MDTKGLQKEFISWCKSKNKQPKSEDETKQLFVAFMKEKHPEEYKQAVQNQQKQQQAQAKKAAHGTKLTYFKSLKNQCAEDEEVVYFKKGGSVRCGCKKKEDGGEIPTAKEGSAIAKFKKMRAGDKVVNGSTKQPTIDGTKKANEDPNKDMTWDPKLRKMRKMTSEEIARAKKNLADARQGKGEGTPQRKKGGEINKDCGGSAIAKFKAAKCGSKLKKHLLGGSLNGIPFMQQGTPKRGIHLNELEEKQFDPLPPNASRELFVLYYGLPKNFFELDLPIKRKMFLEAYNRVNLPKQKNIIDIIHPESTMQPVIPNTGLSQKTFGTYFNKTPEK